MDKKIGQYVRDKREALKISQEAVANAIGMTQPAYSKIESGLTAMKVNKLYMAADFMGVTIYDILPPSMANGIVGDYLLAPLVHKFRQWWAKRSLK